MKKSTLNRTFGAIRLALMLAVTTILPLALASCANGKDKSEKKHEGHEMPKGDGHEGHSH